MHEPTSRLLVHPELCLDPGQEVSNRNGLVMDCDTTGIEPDFALVKFKKLAGDVYDVDDLQAELMEIDENLARADLSPAQEASHIARRKKIWEEMRDQAESVGGRNSPTNEPRKDGRKKGPQHQKEFAAEVAAVVGDGRNPESVKRDVNLKIKRAETLGPDIDRIAGTSLDKGVEMDALIARSCRRCS